ncbi:flagellar type III secretion system protein FlhB [Tabrizicola sp.]|uniref:EscU/YscU/HrcU family type III secretion system export apparatus switch protein n=1 Tax=Tabrizicola sp. TaxID=2005166 RepID=UPI00286BE9F6|nr:flagellar type III secretion system protein FlhB [Tabrizicola sp.]
MSEEDSDSAEKEHDASQQRLDQARQDGDIPRSADLLAAASFAGFVAAFAGFGPWAFETSGTAVMVLFDQSDSLSRLISTSASGPIGGLMLALALPVMATLMVPIAIVLLVIFATKGFVVAPGKLAPKLSRISPIATMKHKFGTEGLAEFGKSTVKLLLVSFILYKYFTYRAEDIFASVYLEPLLSTALLARLTVEFLSIIFLVTLVLGGADFLWQRHLHQQRNRMSRKEMMDEFKESEGDPHMKASRRQRAQEVATNRMLTDVAKADVIVVNPTHYAVALRWDRAQGRAPICVAKGTDEIAQRIRERAAEHGVPIHSDPPTARAMFASVDLGQEIRPEHYRTVAAAIRFADAMRKRVKRR